MGANAASRTTRRAQVPSDPWAGKCVRVERYRLLLRSLHATDRPRTGARYNGGNELVPTVGPGVCHWLRDESGIRGALEDVVQGLLFDVENNALWPDEWGPRPSILPPGRNGNRECPGPEEAP